MSDLYQPGHHPDADQLNAFVEHALPAHEREETLAHLALCAQCREIVALSLPPLEETLPQPEAARPWLFGAHLSGWKLLWPVATAAALAILVAGTIHLRKVSTSRIAPVSTHETAKVEPQPSMVERSDHEPESKKKDAIWPTSPAIQANRPFADSNASKVNEFAKNPSPAPPSQRRTAPAKSSLDASSSPPPASFAEAGNAGTIGDGGSIEPNRDAAANTFSLPSTLAGSAAAAAPSASTMAVAGRSTNASPILLNATPAVPDNEVSDLALAMLRLHPLPSGYPALSIVSSGRVNQTLAIDTQGALFLSSDNGTHWNPVASQWSGRAVKVDLAYSLSNRRAAFSSSSAMKGGSHFAPQTGAIGGPALISNGASASSLTGTITDPSGAIIPGATVIVSASPTQLASATKTDITGRYLIGSLPPGNYTVEADARGFNRQQTSAIAVAPGVPAVANLTLAIGSASETVTVSAASAQLAPAAPLAKMKSEASAKTAASPLVFDLTTDEGQHWVSADGLTWKLR